MKIRITVSDTDRRGNAYEASADLFPATEQNTFMLDKNQLSYAVAELCGRVQTALLESNAGYWE